MKKAHGKMDALKQQFLGAHMQPANQVASNLPPANQVDPAREPETLLDTVQRVFLRTITSFLFMTLATVAVGFTALAMHAYALAGSAAIITGLFLTVFRAPIYAELSLISRAVLFYLRGQNWWSQITNNLYVGALPLQNFGHIQELQRLGIGSVVSINLPFEMNAGIFHEPVTQEAWVDAGIAFRNFAIEDSGAITPAMLGVIATHIQAEVAQGRRVYLHCLVGIGRSASAAEAYLIRSRVEGVDSEPTAYRYIQDRRPQASPNAAQRHTVRVDGDLFLGFQGASAS